MFFIEFIGYNRYVLRVFYFEKLIEVQNVRMTNNLIIVSEKIILSQKK